MKVQELIALLQEFEPEADVKIMSARHYPADGAVARVVQRCDFETTEEMTQDSAIEFGRFPLDVMIVEEVLNV